MMSALLGEDRGCTGCSVGAAAFSIKKYLIKQRGRIHNVQKQAS